MSRLPATALLIAALGAVVFQPGCTAEVKQTPTKADPSPAGAAKAAGASKTDAPQPGKVETAAPEKTAGKAADTPVDPPTKTPDGAAGGGGESQDGSQTPAKVAPAKPDVPESLPKPDVTAYKVSRKDRKAAKMQWVVCATCHGQTGAGDGPAGAALKPKPRTFADKQWQASVTDAHLFKVIKEGGAAVGLSPFMAPNAHLPDGTIHALVEMVRKFGPKD